MDGLRNINKDDFLEQTSDKEKIIFLLNYAVLAPSIYNSQPWLFKINENKCLILRDPKVKTSEEGLSERNLYISLGCALENLIIAAKYFGVFEKLEYVLDREKHSIAEISFAFKNKSFGIVESKPLDLAGDKPLLNKEYEKLVDFMPSRQNARGTFKSETIPSDILYRLSMFSLLQEFEGLRVDFITNQEQIASLGKLTRDGVKLAHRNKAFRKKMAECVCSSYSKRKDGLPGYALKIPSIFSLIIPHLITFINLGSLFAKLDFKSFRGVSVVCVLGVNENASASPENNNIKKWVGVGRLAERLFLEFAARGYDTSIFSAAVQVGELYKEVQKVVGMTERPQLIFCIGHISRGHRFTPRHEISDKLQANA